MARLIAVVRPLTLTLALVPAPSAAQQNRGKLPITGWLDAFWSGLERILSWISTVRSEPREARAKINPSGFQAAPKKNGAMIIPSGFQATPRRSGAMIIPSGFQAAPQENGAMIIPSGFRASSVP